MSDNILTTDRNSANIALAAKDVAGVLVPRNMLTDDAGATISPATAGKQDTGNTALAAIQAALADPATETTLAALLAALGTPLQAGGTVVGPLTNTELRATPVPVSGSFYQATQPVSGTFWQATQPVSGTFWQATQPVSLASVPSHEVTNAGTFAVQAAQSGSWTVAVTGTFWQTTQPISAASLPLPGGAATESTLAALSAQMPASVGPKAGASSLSTVEATPTTVTIVSLQTNATGTTYNAFASQACEQLDIVNTAPSAVDLEVRRGGSGNTIIVPGGSSRMFVGLSNASDLQVRRQDTSNTQVTFTAEAIKA